jgi:hypothetical protein
LKAEGFFSHSDSAVTPLCQTGGDDFVISAEIAPWLISQDYFTQDRITRVKALLKNREIREK